MRAPATLMAMKVRRRSPIAVAAALLGALLLTFTVPFVTAAPADAQPVDDEVPPGNPVIGSDRPGDTPEGETNYALWGLVAVCLIGAGVLLVTIERWEGRRIAEAERVTQT